MRTVLSEPLASEDKKTVGLCGMLGVLPRLSAMSEATDLFSAFVQPPVCQFL